VGACIRSDVILIDEALSVGDLAFQNKCLARIKAMHEQGAAIVLVTHSLDIAEFIAQRGIVMDEGRVVAAGSSVEALRAYEQLVFHGTRRGRSPLPHVPSQGSVTILSAGTYGADGRRTTALEMGAPFGIEVECDLHRPLRQPLFSLAIVNAAGITCVWNISAEDGLQCSSAHGRLRLRLWFAENRLMKGHYNVDFALQDGVSFEVIEQLAGVTSFALAGSGRARGIVAMSPRWELVTPPAGEEEGPR
jgi:hypothetical protein